LASFSLPATVTTTIAPRNERARPSVPARARLDLEFVPRPNR
jgi:hypothetical protein